jgi:hypothetical protein
VLFLESWAPFESVGYRKPSSLSFSNVQAVCLLNGGSRFEKNEPGGQNRPVVIVVGFDQIVPRSQSQESQRNSCGNPRDIESSPRWLAWTCPGCDFGQGPRKMFAVAAVMWYDMDRSAGRRSSSVELVADVRNPRTKGWTEAAVSPFQVVHPSGAARSSRTFVETPRYR